MVTWSDERILYQVKNVFLDVVKTIFAVAPEASG